jgi:hypothetical protein
MEGLMLQSPKATRRKAKPAPAPKSVDPAKIETRFYGLIVRGDCLAPEFKDGDTVVVDKEGPLLRGCNAVFYHRPELVPPCEWPLTLKRLATAVPQEVTLPYREHPDSEVKFIVVVEQANPPKRWAVPCEDLLAVHHCLGRADDPAVKAKLAAEGWWI